MIEWDDKYCVGVPTIDKDHKKFIGIISKVVIVKKNNDDPEGVKEILREMTNYALTHFKTEETYMIEHNYPEYQDHKGEHHVFAMKTIAYLDKVIKGDYQVASDILEDLKSWLVNHIQVTDRKYIDYFKRNSLK
jgi:hemerythrin-like metal-binding protein